MKTAVQFIPILAASSLRLLRLILKLKPIVTAEFELADVFLTIGFRNLVDL